MDTDPSNAESVTVALLQQIRDELRRQNEPLGLVENAGRRFIAAYQTDGVDTLWHRYNRATKRPEPVHATALRGYLRNVYRYDKETGKGVQTKVCVVLDCGTYEEVVEAGMIATTGRGMLAALLVAPVERLLSDPVMVSVHQGTQDEDVTMLELEIDGQRVISRRWPPQQDLDACVEALRSVRKRLGLTGDLEDPYDTIDASAAHTGAEGARDESGAEGGPEDEAPTGTESPSGEQGAGEHDAGEPIDKRNLTRLWEKAQYNHFTKDLFCEVVFVWFGVLNPRELRRGDLSDALQIVSDRDSATAVRAWEVYDVLRQHFSNEEILDLLNAAFDARRLVDLSADELKTMKRYADSPEQRDEVMNYLRGEMPV